MSLYQNTNNIPEKDLIELLEKEDIIRKSESTQRWFEEVEKSVDTEWMQVASKIQFDIVKEYLLLQKDLSSSSSSTTTTTKKVTQKDVKDGVKQLREAARRYPGNEIAHYVKYNRARNCPIQVGDIVPNILLARASNRENVMLLHQCDDKQLPLVLVAGSIS